MANAVCCGHTAVFFAPPGERPEAREIREGKARGICHSCPVMDPCRSWAREHREYGFWGGESEEERAAAGYPVPIPLGRASRLIRSWRANASAPSPPASGGAPAEDITPGRLDSREELRRLLISRALRDTAAASAERGPET
jgi:WhiB family redox-sensing transcriptional regulator